MPPSGTEQSRWFEDEVRPHEDALRAYLHARFASLGDTDDIVQETYTRILRVHTRGEVRSIKALLFTTARNAALDVFRRRRAERSESLSEGEGTRLVSELPNAAEQASRRQELEILAEAITELPDRCRAVMLLRYRDGLACKEIATRLMISPETVKVHLARGMRQCTDFFVRRGLIAPSRSQEAAS